MIRHLPLRLRTFLCLPLALAGLSCGPRSAEPPNPAADLVLRGGPIYTMDAARSWARAVAIRDGKIVYVGTEEDVQEWTDEQTKVVDLEERMVLPSFQDAHIHPILSGVQAAAFLDLTELENREDYLAAIESYAKENPERAWIQGGGWSMDQFEQAIPDGREIDAIVPDRPVYLTSADGHSAWVNAKALASAGITRDTPDPVDGRIDRDPDTGEPIGALQEGAMELIQPPKPTPEQLRQGLLHALRLLNGFGITAFQDAAVYGRPDLELYRSLDQRGELTAKVVAALWWENDRGEDQIPEFVTLREEFTKGRIKATTVKIMQDGVMENHTAALLAPYLGKGDETGIPMVEPEALKRFVTRLDAEGFQVHFHAIGDGAIRQSLDAVEAARNTNGPRDARHHISHLQLFDPADIPRFRELGVVANFQPLWAVNDEYITRLTVPFLGPERSQWLYPIGSLRKSGAVVAFGSDWNVTTPNVFEQMEVAVTRLDPDGLTQQPLLPEQAIDLPAAVAAFTIAGAYVNGLEDETGSIEVGKSADLVVVDRNIFEIPTEELSETEVLLTLLDGQAVHGDLIR
ncbi:MAG: amidohydrolase [Myxococcota bacterium]